MGRNDIWLRNSLAAADGQWEVIIRMRTHLLGYKFVPRHRGHRGKYGGIMNTATPQLLFNHFRALCCVFFFLKHA